MIDFLIKLNKNIIDIYVMFWHEPHVLGFCFVVATFQLYLLTIIVYVSYKKENKNTKMEKKEFFTFLFDLTVWLGLGTCIVSILLLVFSIALYK